MPSRELNISHLGTRKIINSKVTAGRGYVIVPRSLTGRRMTYIFPIWLWFLFPASGASVSTPMDRKTSEMSCATQDESQSLSGPRGLNGNSNKQGDPLILHAVLRKLWSFPNLTHRDVHIWIWRKKHGRLGSPIATHTSSLLDVRAEFGLSNLKQTT